MIELKTPRGLPAFVPETHDEDPTPKYTPDQVGEIARYYDQYGYAVIRGCLGSADCDSIRGLWAEEVKPSRDFIYRQATAKAERHVFNEKGWVMNPILNLQSVNPKTFGRFRRFAIDKILTNPTMAQVLASVLKDTPKIVQSMYFEGNSATWEHQDTYYLDSEQIGSMAAAWLALEDIGARAGRFFVCSGSHKIDMGRQTYANNIADHHEDYIQSIVDVIREQRLEIRAPKLDKGDVLIWNARTIHGSLDSQDVERTRASITLHAIPAAHRFLQLQNRIVPLKTKKVNGVLVHHPKDLSQPLARLVLLAEARVPWIFYPLKSMAVRLMLATKSPPTFWKD
jgi:phytanoyl-CoA hydroxylase